MLTFALKLLIAHVIGDFVLQPNAWVKDKKQKKHKSKFVYFHGLIHLILLIVVLEFNFSLWPYILLLVGSHLIIDLGKLYLQNAKNSRILFFFDQILHLIVIALVVYLNYPFSISIEQLFSKEILLTVLTLIMLTSVSSILIKIIMSKWELEDTQPKMALKDAGAYIGALERLFIFLFIVLNQWTAIGFLITAKSVFRFGDLSRAKDRKLTEYILIGTLCSFLIAVIVGLIYRYLIKI